MKKLFSLLVIIMVALVITGCKQATTTKSTTGTTGTGTTDTQPVNNYVQGVTATTIKVGNCASTSGAASIVGIPFNKGIEAYLKMVNDAGGVGGRTIQFIHQDDESTPAKGSACVDSLINDEKIFAFVGHFGSGTVAATMEDIKDAGIPVVYFASGLSSLYKENATGRDRGLYPVQPILVMEGRIMVARAVAETNAKKIGAIYTSDDAGTDMINGIENQVTKLGTGYSLVKQQVAVGASDYSAAVAKMKSEGVEVIIVATIQATFTPVVKELAKQNNDKPVFTSYNNADPTLITNVKADVGTKFQIYTNAWVDISNVEAVTLFATEITEFTGDAAYAGNAFAMAGWIAGHFFVEGLKNVDGDLTWNSYMNGIESEPVQNPFGGTISYANGQRLGTQSMSLLKMNIETNTWDAFKPFANIESILGE